MAGADSNTITDDIRRIYDKVEASHAETMNAISAVKQDVSSLALDLAVDKESHKVCRGMVMGNGKPGVATRLTRIEIGVALAFVGVMVAMLASAAIPWLMIGSATR
jgi:hypothetical protein